MDHVNHFSNQLLNDSEIKIECQITYYNGSTRIARSRSAAGNVKIGNDLWSHSLVSNAVGESSDGLDIAATFTLREGYADSVALGISFTFEDWSTRNYVVMPSAVFAGNRFQCLPLQYPPFLPHELRGKSTPQYITNVPRLNTESGPSRIQQLTRDLSTPAVGIYDPDAQEGYWFLVDPSTRLGDSGIDLEENTDRTKAVLSFMAPGVREEVQYFSAGFGQESMDRGADFEMGESLTMSVRMFTFRAANVTELFDRFITVRHDRTGRGELQHDLPFSAAWKIAEEKYNRDNWDSTYNFYSLGGDSVFGRWQTGWVGGLMSTHPLLMLGSRLSIDRARQTFDFVFDRGQSDFGLFYGTGDGKQWYGDDFTDQQNKSVHLIRKSADALYFLLKQLDLLQKQGVTIEDRWETGTQKLADSLVEIWRKEKQFGQFVNTETGEVLIGGSTAAGIAGAGLALAGLRFGDSKYLEVAELASEQYFRRDVLAGVTSGAPGEILQCPDSESAFGLLESFIVLYEATGMRKWIEMAKDMANQCAAWTVSYDWPFPEHTLFGELGLHSAGAVWANVQNKHGAPAICTLSGDSLWKLFRATGDFRHIDMLRETAHNLTQYLSRDDRPIGGMPSGWMNERVNLSDFEKNIGGVFYGSCWPLEAMMLTIAEVPGIYVQPDSGLVVVFDHVNVEVVDHNGTEITLRISNPTRYSASVRIFCESSRQTSVPLGQNSLFNRPLIELDAGTSKTIRF